MITYKRKLAAGALGAIFLASLACAEASAQTRYVDPYQLGPRARARALYGPLGDTDPWGRPAGSGCQWSRIQVPTAQGLRWMAMEECSGSPFWR